MIGLLPKRSVRPLIEVIENIRIFEIDLQTGACAPSSDSDDVFYF